MAQPKQKEREKEDGMLLEGFKEKMVSIRRTSIVRKGGRKFGFSALVVVGDGNGKVGYGKGKAGEVPMAIQKATDQARKNMFQIPLIDGTIYHGITWNYGASKIFMKPASEGTGIIAGGPMRPVFEVLGVQNVLAKCIGSTNPNNVVRATVEALRNIVTPEYAALKRGKSVQHIMEDRHE